MKRAVLLTALTATALVATCGAAAAQKAPAAAPAVDSTASAPASFLSQRIDWRPCDFAPDEPLMECGAFRAPMDWASPANGQEITVAASRLRAASGRPQGAVFVNPGGPGGPALDFPLAFRDRTHLVDAMDVIGFDVRGTGKSTRVSCDERGIPRDDLDPRDRGPENLAALLEASADIARTCQAASGAFGRFVTTEQTVRDLDLLRHLLGQEKIHWLGYSAGTWTGAHYATLFKHRVGRFVFDSNLEFTGTTREAFLRQSLGFERRFRVDFLGWVARHDATYHLGTTAEAVRLRYEHLRALLAEEPLDLGEGTLMHPNTLDYYLTSGAMYSKHSFPGHAATIVDLLALAESRQVTATEAAELRQRVAAAGRTSGSDLDGLYATFWHILCNDTPWEGGRDFVIRESERLGAQFPLIGYNTVSDPMACQFWNRPQVTKATPDGVGVPPVLMVQSQNDPATPIEGALRAHQRFAGSRMLTVVGEGDHGVYNTGNTCVDNAVERYLVDGVVPAGDTTCSGTPMPEPTSVKAVPGVVEHLR